MHGHKTHTKSPKISTKKHAHTMQWYTQETQIQTDGQTRQAQTQTHTLSRKTDTETHTVSTLQMTHIDTLTLCQVQRPKMSMRGCRQNVPKCPVMIGKLCCFYTRKFPYNLARISWIVTVWDFRYFLLHHCLCVWSESERVFESRVNETRCRFLRRVSSTVQTTTNNSMAFVLKILYFEKL